jgi:hypothetical protein
LQFIAEVNKYVLGGIHFVQTESSFNGFEKETGFRRDNCIAIDWQISQIVIVFNNNVMVRK